MLTLLLALASSQSEVFDLKTKHEEELMGR